MTIKRIKEFLKTSKEICNKVVQKGFEINVLVYVILLEKL
jgi:hypothetical protein